MRGSEHLIPIATKCIPLAIGMHVCIRGLRNHPDLNGCLGRIVECHEDNNRYEIRASGGGQLFRVKRENLLLLENESNEAALGPSQTGEGTSGPSLDGGQGSSEEGAVGTAILKQGSVVQLCGLKSTAQFNGLTAEVLAVDHAKNRYEIVLNDGRVKTVRAENVRLIQKPRNGRQDPTKGGA